MTVKLIVYMVQDNVARSNLHDKVKALGAYVFELSGSTYALLTPKSVDTITEALTPTKTPDGQFRFFVIEVTDAAAVAGYSSGDSNAFLAWLKAKGQITAHLLR